MKKIKINVNFAHFHFLKSGQKTFFKKFNSHYFRFAQKKWAFAHFCEKKWAEKLVKNWLKLPKNGQKRGKNGVKTGIFEGFETLFVFSAHLPTFITYIGQKIKNIL